MEDEILIDNYLKGLLSENEKELFFKRIYCDSEFKKNFELEKQLYNALDDKSWSFGNNKNSEVKSYINLLEEHDLQNLKNNLSKINSQFNHKKSKPLRHLFFYIIAASIVVFIGFQYFFTKNISNQELYYDNIALNDLPSFVSRGDNSNQLNDAQYLFENYKYAKALAVFISINEQQDYKGTLLIYRGISEAELGRFEDAEKTFNNLINSNLLDAEKGYWYKALILLKEDKLVESKKILIKIVSDRLYKYNEAKLLLGKIKN